MDISKAIETLRKEAEKNTAVKDVLKMWAGRERARGQVTLRALTQRMVNEENKKHDPAEYAKLLKLLGNLGLGQLKYDRTGEVLGIFNVQAKLQSIGQAALGKGKSIEAFKQRAKYKPIDELEAAESRYEQLPLPASNDKVTSIAVPLNGQLVQIQIPSDLTDAQLGAFIKKLLGN